MYLWIFILYNPQFDQSQIPLKAKLTNYFFKFFTRKRHIIHIYICVWGGGSEPVPVAARSKAWVCGSWTGEAAGSNHAGGIDFCLLWVLCVVRQRSLRRADHSSREVLPTVVSPYVWSRNLKNEPIGRVGPKRHKQIYIYIPIKVRQPHYSPGQTLRVPGGSDSQISRQSAHVIRLSALPTGRLYPPENITGTHFCWRLSQPQGHSAWKISMTPSGIEPATFGVVAQCLNQLRHLVPPYL